MSRAQPGEKDREALLVGRVLREAREDLGLKQAALGEKLGVPYNGIIARIELGERKLGLLEFLKYAEALEVDPHTLLQAIQDRLATK